MSETYALELRGISKSFGSSKANVDIDFTVSPGEVRGLVGENGSGKSTLMSIVAGIYSRDSGDLFVDGKPYEPTNPTSAYAAGIAMVTQELGLINDLSATANVFLGNMKSFSNFGIVNLRKASGEAKRLMDEWGFPQLNLNALSSTMSIENQKTLEIARALSIDPQIIILDEVTQALSQDNRQRLYQLIAKFKEMNKAVIVVSHDIEEVVELTDSISILRDGRMIDTVMSRDITAGELKNKMVGRELSENYYRTDEQESRQDDLALSVKDITTENGMLKDLTFDLYKGEILGCCGLSDAGIHDLGRAVFGLLPLAEGSIEVNQQGTMKKVKNAPAGVTMGMAYVPKDRDGEALMLNASVKNNLTLPAMESNLCGPMGFVLGKKSKELVQSAVDDYQIKCKNSNQFVLELSGGNKQKVNIGRWFAKGVDILIVDCPTRGVDIGVKAYIYQNLMEAKERGMAILLISDELPEAIGMCDRIMVIKEGSLAKEFQRSEGFSEEKIIEVMV